MPRRSTPAPPPPDDVDLNQVVLNITGQTGAGNLLGNLLCAVAGLLDGTGINGLATLLNRLLGL